MRRITKPLFLNTGWIYQDIIRRGLPIYVKGVKQEPAPTIVRIKANIQPAVKSNTTSFTPEEATAKRAIMIWSTSPLFQRDDHQTTHQADRLEYKGELYEIVKCVSWEMGPLNHYEALAYVVEPT